MEYADGDYYDHHYDGHDYGHDYGQENRYQSDLRWARHEGQIRQSYNRAMAERLAHQLGNPATILATMIAGGTLYHNENGLRYFTADSLNSASNGVTSMGNVMGSFSTATKKALETARDNIRPVRRAK